MLDDAWRRGISLTAARHRLQIKTGQMGEGRKKLGEGVWGGGAGATVTRSDHSILSDGAVGKDDAIKEI